MKIDQATFGYIVRVKQFAPVIKLAWVDEPERSEQLITDYIVTEELAELFTDILGSQFPGHEPTLSSLYKYRSHLITAQYGSGKTYFLLMLAGMLNAMDSKERSAQVSSKFSGFAGVLRTLNQMKGRRYLVVHFSAKGQGHFPFKELLIKHLLRAAREVKKDIVLESEYASAAEHLARIMEKPTGKHFATELDERQDMTITQLREGLLDLRPTSLQIYRSTYRAVVGAEPSRVGLDMKHSLLSIRQELRELGYTDVAVIVDELTQYLISSMQHYPLANTLGELENLAEFCNNERNRYLFIGAMHRSLDRIMREHGMDPEEREDHQKMRGRFDDHDIMFRGYNELLGRIFEIKKEPFAELKRIPPVRKQLADWRQDAMGSLEGESVEPLISSYFPLHPATLRYLRGVTARLGRETRTAFQFIADVIKPQINERPLLTNGQVNVFTPDELFDYFLPDMDQDRDVGLVVAYNTTQGEIGSDPLAMRAFKCLAMQYINSTVADLRVGAVTGMTVEELGDTLNLSNTRSLKGALEKLRAIRPQSVHYDTETKQYWFGLGGAGWDIDAAIAERDKINPNQVLRDVLRKESLRTIRGRVVMNAPSSVTVVVKRSLEYEWRDVKWLQEAKEISPARRAEAKLVFIVPGFAEGYDGISTELEEQAKKLSETGICVVLPKSTMMLNASDFRKLAALRQIAKSEDVAAHEQRMRIVNSRLQKAEETAEESLSEFLEGSNYVYYIGRRRMTVQNFEEAVERLFADLYPQFPSINMESVSGRGVTNPVIDGLIANRTETLPDSAQSVSSRFIRQAMSAMGLVSMKPSAGGQFVSLATPETSHPAYDIWREIVDSLDEANQPIGSLYDALMNPPYGLPDFLVEVYFSTYLALRKGAVIDRKTQRVETSPSANLAKLITKEKDSRFEVIPPGESEESLRHFMISVWEMTEKAVGLRHHKNTDARTLDDQALWFNQIRSSLQVYIKQVLNPVREALEELSLSYPYWGFTQGLSEVVTSVEEYIIPSNAYNQVYELCIELPPATDEGNTPSDDSNVAFYRFQTVNDDCLDFLKDDESGKEQMLDCIEAIKPIWELRRSAEGLTSPDHEQRAEDTAEKFARCQENVFDKQARKSFVTSTHALWDGYVQEHQTEHDIIMQLRKAFGEDVLRSPVYSLLQRLNPLNDQFGLRTTGYFENQINEIRATAHNTGQEPSFPTVTCPECGVFSAKGDSEEESKTLRQQSNTLAEALRASAQECLERLMSLDEEDEFLQYLSEEEEPASQQLWQDFTGIMRQHEQDLVREEVVQGLLGIATRLVELVQRFQGYKPPPPPPIRVHVDALASSFTQFLRGQGIAEYSYLELRDKVGKWLADINREKFVRHG
jgi:hypothetical protein